MFLLSALEEEIRVQPQDLHKSPVEAVTAVVEERYLDKVIPDLGLVVTLYDIQSIEGGFIYPNDGAAYFRCKFQLVVFRPFVGELLVGNLKSCSKDGLFVSLDFFEDVFVPEHALQEPSFFNDEEKLWIWKFEDNDMVMEVGEPVMLKVTDVKFNQPPTPQELEKAAAEEKPLGTVSSPFVPMLVVGDMNGDGLGMRSWWEPADDAGPQDSG